MDANAISIPDSTDWLQTPLAGFAPLEAALRCQVCKDFFDTPMMTSCSHTFCSLCIRRCFAMDGRCPTCRTADQDSKLRRNWTASELVDAFQAARPQALALARKAKDEREFGSAGEGRKTRGGGNNKKRKLEEVKDSEDEREDEAASRPARKTRSQARRSVTSSQTPEVINLEDDEGSDFAAEEESGDVESNDGLVACPMCNKRMKEEAVFPHLDRCEGPDKGSSSSRSTRPSRNTASSHPLQQRSRDGPTSKKDPEPLARLPQLNYSLLKDQALRKKLAELGIPTSGTRAQQIRRHTEWVNLWNANVDSLRPKTKRELLFELEKWERSLSMESGGGSVIGGAAGSQVMKKDFDGEKWAKSNKSHFDELIASARAKRSAPEGENEAKEKENNMSTKANGATAPSNSASSSEEDQQPHSYEDNKAALEKVRDRVDDASRGAPSLPHRNSNTLEEADPDGRETHASSTTNIPSKTTKPHSNSQKEKEVPSSLPGRLASPSEDLRKKPMFEVPSEPVMDVDTEAGK